MLDVQSITVSIEKNPVLKQISLQVPDGKIVTVIGPNGAGKTTLLRALSGLVRVDSGQITFNGTRLNHLKPHRIVRLGISQIPERGRIFPNMTVLEHLQMGAWTRRRSGSLDSDMETIFNFFPRLKERRQQTAGTLSGGERQMVAIARALMSRPGLLILDEPTLGLAPVMRKELAGIIRQLNTQQTTILLIEQDAAMALAISHRGYVLETGRIVLSGDSEDLRRNENVMKSYLGIS